MPTMRKSTSTSVMYEIDYSRPTLIVCQTHGLNMKHSQSEVGYTSKTQYHFEMKHVPKILIETGVETETRTSLNTNAVWIS